MTRSTRVQKGLTPHEALIYVMIMASAVDRVMSDTELEAIGVRRVSTGGGLARVALTALKNAAEELKTTGTYTWAESIVTTGWVNELMKR